MKTRNGYDVLYEKLMRRVERSLRPIMEDSEPHNPLDDYWDRLIKYGIAIESELQLITKINGYNQKTFDDVLYCRTGYRSWEQYYNCEIMERC